MDFVHVDLKTKWLKDYLLRILFFFFHSVKQETGNNNDDDDDDDDDDDNDNNKYELFLEEAERMR